jgi:hypothetical protein
MNVKRLLFSVSHPLPAPSGAIRWVALSSLVLGLLASSPEAWAQKDDFNDNNDTGWQRYSPLAQFGVPTVFTATNGVYRIQTTVPTGMQTNPGRAGSVRPDVIYTDFFLSVDIVNWNHGTRQAFGLLARVGTPGLQTTTGYAFTWERGSNPDTGGDLDISKITGEVPSQVPTGPSAIHLDPGNDYRFVFIGRGAQLEGRVYQLPNTETPLITISGSDSTYASGMGGLVIYDNSGGNGVTDATFDNYCGLVEEPPKLTYTVDQNTREIIISWPNTYRDYVIQSSPVLPAIQWTDEVATESGDIFYYLGPSEFGNRFFRLKKMVP